MSQLHKAQKNILITLDCIKLGCCNKLFEVREHNRCSVNYGLKATLGRVH